MSPEGLAPPALQAAAMPEGLDAHYGHVLSAIVDWRLVPFLGAGANLCGRPAEVKWDPGQSRYLPHGGELAGYLAEEFHYPRDKPRDLARVSQYAAVKEGTGPLFEKLEALFAADHPPTALHRFLARLPAAFREKGRYGEKNPLGRRPVFVSTNYDDLLEQALREEGEPFHLVAYEAEGERRGKFLHWRSGAASPELIEQPNAYKGMLADELPVVLKIHGSVDRASTEHDSFVITEDHYIDYLARTEISGLIPAPLPGLLKKSNLLFMGYSLEDWNLRVILHRIWGDRKLSYKSWAIQLGPDELDREFWRSRDVDILDQDLADYVDALGQRVDALPPRRASE